MHARLAWVEFPLRVLRVLREVFANSKESLMKQVLVASISLACAAVLLTGCALQQTTTASNVEPGLALAGSIYGGQQPVTASHLYLMAAGTSGYGKASASLLTTGDGSDSNGTSSCPTAAAPFPSQASTPAPLEARSTFSPLAVNRAQRLPRILASR